MKQYTVVAIYMYTQIKFQFKVPMMLQFTLFPSGGESVRNPIIRLSLASDPRRVSYTRYFSSKSHSIEVKDFVKIPRAKNSNHP